MTELEAAREDTLARLARSRAEIQRVFEPPPRAAGETPGGGPAAGSNGGEFPRSRTMRLLMSGRGIGTVGAVIGGLALARPALVFRLLRLLPVSAVARVLLLKAITSLRSKQA